MIAPGPLTRLLVASLAALLLVAAPGAAQAPEPEERQLLRELREHQRRFERVRRNHLPWAWSGGRGECDERIGRFCLTHGSGSSDWKPEPEHERVTAAREALLDALEAGAARLPTQPWIAGQRVRYLLEASLHDKALSAAGDCEAERWWCLALTGFAHHYAGHPAAADSAFSSALAAMPEPERRAWTDLSVLLDACTVKHYRRLEPAARSEFEERFWRFADPFHTRPGNETRSEHLARHVWDGLQDRAASADGLSWGADLRQILLRYGWPEGWERVRSTSWGFTPPSMVSHYAGSDRDLLPPCELLRDGDLIAGEWDQEPPKPRTGYAMPMPDSVIEWLGGVDYQVAVFRPGDSAVVVAGYAVPADSLREDAHLESAVALLTSTAERAGMMRFENGGHSDAVSTSAPQEPLLLTIEGLSLEARRAIRIRYGIDVPRAEPGLLGLSDLLLLAAPEPLPRSLTGAIPLARRSTRVAAGEALGVYWEVYGLDANDGEDVSFAFRLLEMDGSLLRGIGRSLGLLDDSPPVLVRWHETPGPRRVFPRSLALRIPDEIRPGRYALELTVVAAGREPLSVRRPLTVHQP